MKVFFSHLFVVVFLLAVVRHTTVNSISSKSSNRPQKSRTDPKKKTCGTRELFLEIYLEKTALKISSYCVTTSINYRPGQLYIKIFASLLDFMGI